MQNNVRCHVVFLNFIYDNVTEAVYVTGFGRNSRSLKLTPALVYMSLSAYELVYFILYYMNIKSPNRMNNDVITIANNHGDRYYR